MSYKCAKIWGEIWLIKEGKEKKYNTQLFREKSMHENEKELTTKIRKKPMHDEKEKYLRSKNKV